MSFEDLREEYPNSEFYSIPIDECWFCGSEEEPVLDGLGYTCPDCGRPYRPRKKRSKKQEKKTAKALAQKKTVPLITVFADEGGSQ